MSEAVQDLAEVPAPEQAATAAPVTDASLPEDQTTEAPKTFTQEELDAIVGKRLAREQRKWEREQAQRQAELETRRAMPVNPPAPDDFNNAAEYAEALAERKAQELVRQREQPSNRLNCWKHTTRKRKPPAVNTTTLNRSRTTRAFL